MLVNRITTLYIEGNGDGCPLKSRLKDEDITVIFAEGDFSQALLQFIISRDYVCSSDKEMLVRIINSISDIMGFVYDENYKRDMEGMLKALVQSIEEIKGRTPDCPEFPRYVKSPGVELNLVRTSIRKLELEFRKKYPEQEIMLSFINRLSSYLWWLSWDYCHDDCTLFWE